MFKQLYLGKLKERCPRRQTFVPGSLMYSLFGNNKLKREDYYTTTRIHMLSKQQPWLLVVMMCRFYRVPQIMFPTTLLKLPFQCGSLQLCTCVPLHLCFKWRIKRDSEGNHVQTRRGENRENVHEGGWEISASQPGGNQLWASSGNIQGSIAHIPEGRAD